MSALGCSLRLLGRGFLEAAVGLLSLASVFRGVEYHVLVLGHNTDVGVC